MGEKIAIGSDHAAFEIKEALKKRLRELGYDVEDFTRVKDGTGDYPDVAHPVADAVAKGVFPRAVLLCGAGHGMTYAANRHAGVRAALCLSVEFARLAREHNDSNILTMPGRAAPVDPHEKILEAWLSTPFSGDERHRRRIRKIDHPDGS
ncbi:MAG: RpiB/LacA/LacB family sugar-phosphate isomerase [Planctomycetota bacterium]|jgi:ribose 5-phosphate isomerase B|nr:RpiB/LacA/LacB family sugar-phosphate isomerase [Planctomycetota bacterium]